LLELDIIFERFWKKCGDELSENDAAALARLLQLPDNDLLDLVMGRAQAPDDALRDMVHKLRSQ
jgi:succinate dehydrogenase flavin-adding protein (antitoxin of CptAB toxin-antitoxin module)